MDTSDKILVTICFLLLLFLTFVNNAKINPRPTRAEVITICEELIKANSNAIFDKKNAGRLESCLYKLIEIERGEAYAYELEPYLQWLTDRNEQRIEELNDKLED